MIKQSDVEKVVKHEIGHYILNRCYEIVPTKIHFKYDNYDSLNGDCDNEFNLYFDELEEVSKFSYQRAAILFAGAAASCLNFEFKKINQKQAKTDFEEKEKSDNTKFNVYLLTFLQCEKSIREDKQPETLRIRIQNKIYNEVFDTLEQYSDLIQEITDYILPKVLELCGEGELNISNDELNSIESLCSTFGKREPSIWGL